MVTSSTDVFVQVVNTEDPDGVAAMWPHHDFTTRLYLMREMYQLFVEAGRCADLEVLGYTNETDPFYDPPGEQEIGTALGYLSSLNYLLEIDDAIPIIDFKGRTEGELHVEIVECDCHNSCFIFACKHHQREINASPLH